jgi:hypothetical protein
MTKLPKLRVVHVFAVMIAVAALGTCSSDTSPFYCNYSCLPLNPSPNSENPPFTFLPTIYADNISSAQRICEQQAACGTNSTTRCVCMGRID